MGTFNTSTQFWQYNHKNAGSIDVFLAKYNSSGNVVWAKKAGGSGAECAYSVAVYTVPNIYIVGSFADKNTFGTII